MMYPLVSIIVTNHNYGHFIEECLSSIDAQTYPSIEVIIIDNASTDNSHQIISDFMERRASDGRTVPFRFERMAENLQLTGACVAGFEKSRGAYIVFVDADDTLLPTFVECQVCAHLSMRFPVGISSTDMYQLTPGGIVGTTTPSLSAFVSANKPATDLTRALDRADYQRAFGDDRTIPLATSDIYFVKPEDSSNWVWSPTSALCARRDAVALMFGHAPKLMANVDAYLLRGIGSLTGSLLIDRPLAVYRYHASNIFARGLPLAGFRAFDHDQLAREDEDVRLAVTACYLANADRLAKQLLHHSQFINAVKTVLSSGINPPSVNDPGFVAAFIHANRARLNQAFGPAVVDEWMGWFKRQPWDSFFRRYR